MAGGLNDEGQRISDHYDNGFSPKSRESLGDAERNSTSSTPNDGGASSDNSRQYKSGDDLQNAESNVANKSNSLYTGSEGGGDGNTGGGNKSAVSKAIKGFAGKKKWFFLAGAGGASLLTTLAIVLLIFYFLAPFKNVHFAQILRSVGMARFQMYSKRTYARTIFDAAVLTDSSPKGSSVANSLKDRTMLDRLRGINPSKQLLQLGNQGALKFDFEGGTKWGGLKKTINFSGVELYGQKVSLDQMSREQHSKPYAELDKADKIDVQKSFGAAIQDGLEQQLALDGRGVRSSAFNGFRRASGITMTKWKDPAKYADKTPDEARKLNLEESMANIDGERAPPKSGIKQIQDDADKARADAIKAAQDGKTTSPGQTRSKWAARARTYSNVSTGVLYVTLACIVHSLNSSFQQAKDDTQDKAAAAGSDAVTSGDQALRGEAPLEAMTAESDLWGDADQAVYYKEAVGQPVSQDEKVKQSAQVADIRGPSAALGTTVEYADKVLTGVFAGGLITSVIPGLGSLQSKGIDKGCELLLNQYVQFGIAGVEIGVAVGSAGATEGFLAGVKAFVSGGLQLAAGFGVGQLLGSMIDKTTQAYAGGDYSATATGPQKYNNAAVGLDYMSQTGDRQVYGRPLTNSEAQQSQAVAMADLSHQNRQKSFTERYFALSNPFSLASQTLIKTPTSWSDMATSGRNTLASMASLLLSPVKLINSVSGMLASANRLVFAEGIGATGSGHGVEEWGFTEQEWDTVSTDPNYTWDKLAAFVEPNWDELEGKYRECYTFVKQSERPEKCTNSYLGTDEALKWRIYNAESDAAVVVSNDVNKGDDQ